MGRMAKKKPKPEDASISAPRTESRHLNRHMMNVPDPYYANLKALADRHKRPLTWELRIALERHFAENGLPPIPDGIGFEDD
jgi:hypothetical protein